MRSNWIFVLNRFDFVSWMTSACSSCSSAMSASNSPLSSYQNTIFLVSPLNSSFNLSEIWLKLNCATSSPPKIKFQLEFDRAYPCCRFEPLDSSLLPHHLGQPEHVQVPCGQVVHHIPYTLLVAS